MSSNNNLPVPAEYQQSSQRFSIIWNDYVDREEKAKSEIMNMVKILESSGYTRTQAIEKIKSDHKHLKGFSRATIYRELPDNMKRKYESSNIIMLPDNSDVSNDTFEQESLQELQEEGNTWPLNFVREYLSKDKDKDDKQHRIQEYKTKIVYNGETIPITITLNLNTQNSSIVVDNKDNKK